MINREEETADIGDLPPRHERLDEGGESFVQIEGADPTVELISASTWEELGLPEPVLKAAYAKGFAKPSKIQAHALPLILGNSKQHVIAQAKNGSGKTATFAIAAISRIDVSRSGVQVLLLSPTRELAKQNQDVVDELAKYTSLKTFLACPPAQVMPEGVHLVSGTPGKVLGFLHKRVMDVKSLKMFILDEADMMVNEQNDMGQQVVDIAKRIRREMAEEKPQVLLFSATFPERVRKFAMAMAPQALRLTMKKEELTLSTTRQFWMRLESGEETKISCLMDLYAAMSIGQSVIFVKRREGAERVARRLRDEQYSVTLICGGTGDGLTHEKRAERMQEFRDGVTRVLVTTDLLARGIDVPSVTLVINYDMPMSHEIPGTIDYETYLHRVGRTGRFGQKGIAINFISSESEMDYIRAIEAHYQCQISPLDPDFEMIENMMRNLRV